jgi:hypothetical protein
VFYGISPTFINNLGPLDCLISILSATCAVELPCIVWDLQELQTMF